MRSSSKLISIWLLGVLLPEVIIYFYNKISISDFGLVLQYIGDSVIIIVGIYILATSIMQMRSNNLSKPLGIFFILLSIFSFAYGAIMLWLQYALRNGIGF